MAPPADPSTTDPNTMAAAVGGAAAAGSLGLSLVLKTLIERLTSRKPKAPRPDPQPPVALAPAVQCPYADADLRVLWARMADRLDDMASTLRRLAETLPQVQADHDVQLRALDNLTALVNKRGG